MRIEVVKKLLLIVAREFFIEEFLGAFFEETFPRGLFFARIDREEERVVRAAL